MKIANYELLVRDWKWLAEENLHRDLVVLDEAQRVKNRNGATASVVKQLARTRSWALTGTPVENSPRDLVGVFDFVAPGVLHDDMTAVEMGGAAGDYILRRTKDQVLTDMPPKMYRDAEISLTPEQLDSYKLAEEAGVLRLSEMGAELTIQHVFELVLRLKQICNFDPLSGASSKAERLEADLEEVAASGKKAIVFSQWVRTLSELKERLARFSPLEYHGKSPPRERETVIDRFRNSDKHRVILMSYGAGSVGLNLQFCEYVFLFDRWWNPAVEDQAINRAHRIGAAGAVTVTRMVTSGTIEERIDQVLRDKRALFDAVLGASDRPRQLGLTQDDIFGLFQFAPPLRHAKPAKTQSRLRHARPAKTRSGSRRYPPAHSLQSECETHRGGCRSVPGFSGRLSWVDGVGCSEPRMRMSPPSTSQFEPLGGGQFWLKARVMVRAAGAAAETLATIDRPFVRFSKDPRADVKTRGEKLFLIVTDYGIRGLDLSNPGAAPLEGLHPGGFHFGNYHVDWRVDEQLSGKSRQDWPVLQFTFKDRVLSRRKLQRVVTIIGRAQPSTLCVGHSEISRTHAALYWDGRVLWVIDLFSANGVYTRMGFADCVRLLPGGSVNLGPVVMHYVDPMLDSSSSANALHDQDATSHNIPALVDNQHIADVSDGNREEAEELALTPAPEPEIEPQPIRNLSPSISASASDPIDAPSDGPLTDDSSPVASNALDASASLSQSASTAPEATSYEDVQDALAEISVRQQEQSQAAESQLAALRSELDQLRRAPADDRAIQEVAELREAMSALTARVEEQARATESQLGALQSALERLQSETAEASAAQRTEFTQQLERWDGDRRADRDRTLAIEATLQTLQDAAIAHPPSQQDHVAPAIEARLAAIEQAAVADRQAEAERFAAWEAQQIRGSADAMAAAQAEIRQSLQTLQHRVEQAEGGRADDQANLERAGARIAEIEATVRQLTAKTEDMSVQQAEATQRVEASIAEAAESRRRSDDAVAALGNDAKSEQESLANRVDGFRNEVLQRDQDWEQRLQQVETTLSDNSGAANEQLTREFGALKEEIAELHSAQRLASQSQETLAAKNEELAQQLKSLLQRLAALERPTDVPRTGPDTAATDPRWDAARPMEAISPAPREAPEAFAPREPDAFQETSPEGPLAPDAEREQLAQLFGLAERPPESETPEDEEMDGPLTALIERQAESQRWQRRLVILASVFAVLLIGSAIVWRLWFP